jgi:hypothetical protein
MSAPRMPVAAAALGYWAALPVLALASIPVLVVAVACAGAAFAGAPIVAAIAAAAVGPAWALLAAVAHRVVLGVRALGPADPASVRALPRLARATFAVGLRIVVVPVAAALLVAASAAAADAERVFLAALGVNAAALGGAVIVAPFAFAAMAAGAPDARAAWRIGAGVAAASPKVVIGTLAALVLVVTAARIAGTGVLLLLPAPLALVVAAATGAALERARA